MLESGPVVFGKIYVNKFTWYGQYLSITKYRIDKRRIPVELPAWLLIIAWVKFRPTLVSIND